MKSTERKAIDCRDFPGSNCTLKITGTEDEVIHAATLHGVAVHGYSDTAEFREDLKKTIKTESDDTTLGQKGPARVA